MKLAFFIFVLFSFPVAAQDFDENPDEIAHGSSFESEWDRGPKQSEEILEENESPYPLMEESDWSLSEEEESLQEE